MMLKSFLCVIYLLTIVRINHSLNVGNETFLRQNIDDLLKGKLVFTENNLPYDEDEFPDSTPKNQSEYDFIVIGAGSAGAAIASRLSEIKNVSILLIEAGGKEFSIIDIPGIAPLLQSNNDVDWLYQTESSDKYCLAQKDQKCNLPRGKLMGGTSSINSFTAARGNRRDYDQWASEVGDGLWSYKQMLKYFKKLEDFHSNGVDINRKFHNEGGPVKIAVARNRIEIAESFIQAGIEMGYSKVDYNGPEQIGFFYSQTTIFEGERWSSNRAYLRPTKSRKNLIVTQNSHVHKILIDKTTKTAYGVRYSKEGKIYEVKAKKEVILSAGAINSPQILMLSGIGPEKHLRELDIKVIKDAPVGENVKEHIRYGPGIVFSVNDSSTFQIPNVLDPNDSSIRDYVNHKTGALSVGTSVEALAFVNVDDRNDLHPDIELLFIPGNVTKSKDSLSVSSVEPINTYTINPILMRPRSTGKILLRSKDPLDKPKFIANYFEDPDDLRVLIKGIRLAKKVGETRAMKRHSSELHRLLSDCDVHGVDSNAYWECELRARIVSSHHTLGTCKMGGENSSDAVVNSRLKVIGVNRLRVADASVIPTNICAHTNIPAIAVGERAADLIKMDYGYWQ